MKTIVSKKEAKQLGLKYYFTGQPCKHGHVEKRAISGHCFICRRVNSKKGMAQRRAESNEDIKTYRREWRAGNKEKVKRHNEKYRAAFKNRIIANRIIERAIAKGTLKRMPCEVCGSAKVHAHHSNYNKPLEVKWLCETHHRQWHENNQPEEKRE